MKKGTYKIGDKVRRTRDRFETMHPDDIGTIVSIDSRGDIKLKEFDGVHTYFKFIKLNSIPDNYTMY